MKLSKTMMALGFLALTQAPVASAGSLPTLGMQNVYTYLSTYATGSFESVASYDFEGRYNYTAVGYEAGNQNTISQTAGGTVTFDTKADSNFGTWKEVNFSSESLLFTDQKDGPTDVSIDPFTAPSSYFSVYRLTADVILSYLPVGDVKLREGTFIVGFGDGLGDSDYDDMIVALNPVPVPAAAFLFAPALLGFMGLRRKAKKSA